MCRKCNGSKLDKHPETFYTEDELDKLQPLLNAQSELFTFSFNHEKWNTNRALYLTELGIDKETVLSALNDENSINYIGDIDTGERRVEIRITIDQESIDRLTSN